MSQTAAAQADPDLILGRYRALRPLGSGGSGSVWLSRDEVAGRDVALKVVSREGKAGARAEREAVAVKRLRHRHCARVHTVDRDDHHVYVAYEYVPGCTLREAIRTGLLEDAHAVEAGAQLLEALAHAHVRGVVHRDVKPANVLLVETSEVSVRLLDFGLALMDDADALTATGDVPGTLAYISPERLDGEETTGAADVWAVGVILWEALAGEQLFWSTSPVETVRLIQQGAPPLAARRPDLPRALTTAVDRALALDPGSRPAPKRLAADLRGSLEQQAKRRAHRPVVSRRSLAERGGHAALCAAFVAVVTSLLPFYPQGLSIGLAAVVALAALADPRAGLVAALAVPVLSAGDVSLGLAAVYVPAALAWIVVHWRDPRHSLLFLAGPLLSLVGLLPLLPLLAARAVGPMRRALQAGAGVIAAALVAGLRGAPLPFDGAPPPLGLGIEGSESPGAVASALLGALTDHPLVAVEAAVLALAAVAVPLVRSSGAWRIAAFGATLLAVGLLVPLAFGAGTPRALTFTLAVSALCGALLYGSLRRRRSRGLMQESGTELSHQASS
jgi:hypothetical protein